MSTEKERERWRRNKRRWSAKNSVKQNSYWRNWYKKNSKARIATILQYAKDNPEKKLAHDRVYRALKGGRLTKQPCQVCSKAKVQAHHEDYSKPLEVVWLCALHHRQADKERREKLRTEN